MPLFWCFTEFIDFHKGIYTLILFEEKRRNRRSIIINGYADIANISPGVIIRNIEIDSNEISLFFDPNVPVFWWNVDDSDTCLTRACGRLKKQRTEKNCHKQYEKGYNCFPHFSSVTSCDFSGTSPPYR